MAKTNNIITFVIFLIILCALLAVFSLYKSNAKIVKVSRHYPNKELIYDNYSFRDERFVYLVCDKENFSKCKLVQEKYPYKSIYRTCQNISLGVEKVNKTKENFIFVVAFGEDKVILMWDDDHGKHDKPYVNIRVVDFKKCQQEETKSYALFTTKQLNKVKKIITNYQTFDVFFKNADECGTSECRLRFKNNGNADHIDKLFVNNEYDVTDIYPISHTLSDKRYIYLKSQNGSTGLFLIRSDKTETMLLSLPGDFKISVVNESIGVCSKVGCNTTCYQYDSKVELKLNFTLNDVHNNTELKSIYTLPGKGFLFSFAEFGRCEEEDVCDPELLTTYFIQKVDQTKKSQGKLRFQGLEKDYKVIRHSYIWKTKKNEEYCAFIEPFRHPDRIEFFANCFPISNFHV